MRWIWGLLLVSSVANAKPGVLANGRGRTVELGADGKLTVKRAKDSLALVDIDNTDDTNVTATIAPFLGREQLLDVDIATQWADNHHSRSTHRHFLVDTSQTQDIVACRFDGDSYDTGEYASSNTTVKVKVLKKEPFQFELTVKTDSHSSQPQPAKSESSTRTETKELGAATCVAAAAPTAKARPPGAAPAIELADAIAAARTYAQAHHLDLSKQYLKSASFDPTGRRWDVEWQRPNAKGGNIEFHVLEAGPITVTYGE